MNGPTATALPQALVTDQQRPSSATSPDVEAAACELMGISQMLPLLSATRSKSQQFPTEPLSVVISDDNRHWFTDRRVLGDLLDLCQEPFGCSTRLDAAKLVIELVEATPAEDRESLKPEYGDQLATRTPGFPVQLLPPVLRDFVNEVSRVRNVPAEIVASAVLGVMSGAIGKGLTAKSIGGMTVLPNLNILIGAPSGLGKSIAGTVIFGPVHAFERRVQAEHRSRLTETKAALLAVQREIGALTVGDGDPMKETALASRRLEELREREAALQARIEPPRFIVEDVTSEKLAVLLAANDGTLMSLSTDARSVIKIIGGRYRGSGGTDEDIYLKAFSGDELRQDRISRDAVSIAPCMAVVWMTQMDNVSLMYSKEALTESGLACRFLVCCVRHFRRSSSYDEVTLSVDVLGAYERRISELLETYRRHQGAPRVISASPQARKIIIDYGHDVEARKDEGDLITIGRFASRYAEMAWKLALTLHAAEHGAEAHNLEIGAINAHAAVTIIHWYARQQQEVLGATAEQKGDERLNIARKILQNATGGITPRLLHKAEQTMFPTSQDARDALEALVGEGVAARVGAGKRPKYYSQRAPRS